MQKCRRCESTQDVMNGECLRCNVKRANRENRRKGGKKEATLSYVKNSSNGKKNSYQRPRGGDFYEDYVHEALGELEEAEEGARNEWLRELEHKHEEERM